jgi:GTP-binding protein EngB required for normal cell division
MNSQQFLPSVQEVTFRVLVIGRANSGKTTILQRVCDTTDSPTVYRLDQGGRRDPVLFFLSPSRSSNLIIYPGYNPLHYRGASKLFSLAMGDCEDLALSVAYIT